MTTADTEEPVSWLKQNPNRQSFAKSTYNKKRISMIHGAEMLPKDRRPASPPWSNPPSATDRPSSTVLPRSPMPPASLRKVSSSIGPHHQFIPHHDLDLAPLTIHPRDNEDEEDDNDEDDLRRGHQSSQQRMQDNDDASGAARMERLEEELQTAYRHVDHLKAQLAQHDRSTQALVAKHIEDKERESALVKQLTDLVHTQDQLIQQLQLKHSAQRHEQMAEELAKMRAELDTLHFEKRSLETRMAAFLHEELDMSQVSLLSNDDDELFSVAMGYRSSSEQPPQEVLQPLDLRRRSSSIIDADQYSLMTFGGSGAASHRNSPLPSDNRLSSPVAPSNSATSPASRYTNHSTLNLVEEERDEEDDAVSRYSSLSSSPATMSFASPISSTSDPRYSVLKSAQIRTSLSSVSSSHLPMHGMPSSSPSAATAAAANAARKAAWARIMIPPATPPPSHPLPPLPPHGISSPSTECMDDSDIDEPPPNYPAPPSPPQHRLSSPTRESGNPLMISTADESPSSPPATYGTIDDGRDSVLSSAPPIMSPQRESLESATKSGRESAATIHSSGTDESSSRESKQGFWKGVKKKWRSNK